MKYIALIALVTLSACGDDVKPTIVPVPKPVVFMPDERFNRCPSAKIPNPDTLTDEQVSTLLFDLDRVNKVCRSSLNGMWDQLEAAKRRLETADQ